MRRSGKGSDNVLKFIMNPEASGISGKNHRQVLINWFANERDYLQPHIQVSQETGLTESVVSRVFGDLVDKDILKRTGFKKYNSWDRNPTPMYDFTENFEKRVSDWWESLHPSQPAKSSAKTEQHPNARAILLSETASDLEEKLLSFVKKHNLGNYVRRKELGTQIVIDFFKSTNLERTKDRKYALQYFLSLFCKKGSNMSDEQYKTWLNNTKNSLTECYKEVFEIESVERLWHKRDEVLAKELQALLKKEKLVESLKMQSPNDQFIIHLDELYDDQLEDFEFQFTTQGCQDHLFNSIAKNFCVTILDLNTSLSNNVKQKIGFNYAPNPQIVQWLDNLITPALFRAKNETLPDNMDWIESLRMQEVLMMDKSLQAFLEGGIETPACYKPYAIIFRYYWDNLIEAQNHAQNLPAILTDKIHSEGQPGFNFNEFSIHRLRIAERSKPGLEMGLISEKQFQDERLSCLNSW